MKARSFRLALVLALCSSLGVAQQLTPERQLAHDVFKQLIEINTTWEKGTRQIADAVAARLKAAGFADSDINIVGPADNPKKANLLVRYRGSNPSLKPILLMAHMDVVEAKREDWTMDPFTFNERDGYYYGRGTTDDKVGDAEIITNFIRWKQEGWQPLRDVIAVLTTDEEGGDPAPNQGIAWLVANRPELLNAEYAINTDAGGGEIRNGKRTNFNVQASEKIYADFEFKTTDRGGHSSQPRNADNPIYRIAAALQKLDAYQFPIKLNDITRGYFERSAALQAPPMAADMRALASGHADAATTQRLAQSPMYNAMMRTTCVATELQAGHAPNALPQLAQVNVNCRILPDDDLAGVERTLRGLFADSHAEMNYGERPKPSPPSPLRPEMLQVIEKLVQQHFPGSIVIPVMETGATDGLYFRNKGVPVYGISAVYEDPSDVRAHGRDERIQIQSFFDAVDFWHDMVKELAGK